MLQLSAFGGVALLRDGRPIVGAAAPRRLALLLLLAASGDRGLPREAIVDALWPDSDAEEGRHSLHQTLYLSRRALEDELLFLGTATLLLNPACIQCDIWEFETALRARQLERAVALYRGPFADGFGVKGVPEIEWRLEPARARFARQWSDAVEALARAAADRHDYAESARWWERLVQADRLSTHAATGLIGMLVAAGEAANALKFALVHEAIVRQETGRPPDSEILQWIQRLRGGAPTLTKTDTPRRRSGEPMISDRAHDGDDSVLRWRTSRLSNALGRGYRLKDLFEEGSIAMTYSAATTEAVAREVEVHVILPPVSPSVRGRFRSSMERTIALLDPHILPTIDFGFVDANAFYISARRSRPSLRERLRAERALPIDVAITIALDIAAALAHAHTSGVHHGDLRPKHVGLAGTSAIVGGFGVIEGLTSASEMSARTTLVTLGSPTYLSPEQLSSSVNVDARSDIYAFGCILYEMLIGEPPFGGRLRVRRKLTEEPPALRHFRESVPETLERVVQKCLMRVPADRFEGGDAVARALGSVEAQASGPMTGS